MLISNRKDVSNGCYGRQNHEASVRQRPWRGLHAQNAIAFGTQGSIDMALSRLAKLGEIRRVGRGLYDYPRMHDKLGAFGPDAGRSRRMLFAVSSQDRAAP